MNYRAEAIATARKYTARKDTLIIDTETTAADNTAEVCQIAVVDLEGNVILNTFIKPIGPITKEAADIHHITDEMVANAPAFADLWPFLRALFAGRLVLSYNAGFDFRVIRQSLLAKGASMNDLETIGKWKTGCIMLAYADFHGEWNSYRRNNKWQSLEKAGRQCDIHMESGKAHSALYDTELARRVLLHMAAYEPAVIEVESDFPDEMEL